MNTPLLTVIVPIYNSERTLEQCLNSILNQHFRDFELLLVDDGSTDSSTAICEKYTLEDKRVQLFHKANGGVSSARNFGLENAKGKWITFVDSDDYLQDSFFDGVNEYDNDLIIHPYVWLKNGLLTQDKRIRNYSLIVGEEQIRLFLNSFLTTLIMRGPCAKFYKKELIGECRFNEKMKVGEDIVFVLQYLQKCDSICCRDSSSYVVRISEVPADAKYACPTNYAVNSLVEIFESFDVIQKKWLLQKKLFKSYLFYFKMISKNDWGEKPSKWYCNEKVDYLYKYVWKDLTIMQKVKYKLLSSFSFVLG